MMTKVPFSSVALCAAAGAALMFSTSAQAGAAASAARTIVRPPVTLANTRALAFGNIVRGTAAGTVSINAQTGARTSTGGVTLIGTTGFSSASFAATALGSTLVRLSVATGTITLTRAGGGATMTLNTLRASAGGGAAQTMPRNYTVPASGTQTFNIGGRLNVAANQAAGAYTGTINVTLNYQ
jgi:hypothetical protein